MFRSVIQPALVASVFIISLNQSLANELLPPVLPWQGSSEALLQASHPLATEFELSQGLTSPDYDNTQAYLDKLMTHSAQLQKISLGMSPQGRDIWMYIVSANGAQDADALKANRKPTLLVQAGIHAGEIDGKDAGMMLIRDIVTGPKAALLDQANLLFIPIFNVDGHERQGQYHRVNQRGPVNMGWRTTANNLNLNRDYAKADSMEMQALLKAINQWQPTLYIDVHVTDGIDYQYDVTFGYNLKQGHSRSIYDWFTTHYRPAIEASLTQLGHIPGPLVFAIDNSDMAQGMNLWNPEPRFSNGYGDVRHLPTVLVENHSLKPYKQRVLGTYVLLEQSMITLGQQQRSLNAAITKDQNRYSSLVTLSWINERQPQGWDFKGIDYTLETSPISGDRVVRWLGTPKLYPNLTVIGNTRADKRTRRPAAYYVPPQWTEVIAKLQLHGIKMSPLTGESQLKLQQYTFSSHLFSAKDYEGRQRVSTHARLEDVRATLPQGTMKISTRQPLGDLAIMLLEPDSPDSLLQWGLFNPIFSRTEYIEDYAVEPLARQMLNADPQLQAEFDAALTSDADFAADPKARLRWFYERSPYYDQQYQVYPVLRGQ
ncbi:M14 family metallopeptidase [Shewanella sp. NIFS-20-20]|uniref:M14 family metallopeptidase n=1 Tax=Shewanella sp. NIFS-20-20 TaxID=2853806 RepID=UPI001C441E6E|nr:M14 family metallopeptidase [Shewanella sp. NIFS-20-20]MBV7316687.1 carboxypeptidase [Shewanella sp. NIFS-20-20]